MLRSAEHKVLRKRITFDGTAGGGAQGTVIVATLTGCVFISKFISRCAVDLIGTSATVEVGVSGTTNGLIAQTTATNIDVGEIWTDSGPSNFEAPISDKVIDDNIIITVGTADVTAGVLDFFILYYPVTTDGFLT